MKRIKIKNTIVAFVAVFTFALTLAPVSVFAQGDDTNTTTGGNGCNEDKNPFLPAWYDNLCKDGNIKSPADMGNDGGKADDTARNFSTWIGIIAMNIVKMLMVVVGYVSLGFIIWGGFKYMISGDSSSGTVAARKTIQNAVIGLVLSITSVAIINFIADAIA